MDEQRHGHLEHAHHEHPHGHSREHEGAHAHTHEHHGDEHHSHEHHGHGHDAHRHHGHSYSLESLRNNDALFASVYQDIIQWLAPDPSAHALDAGCGSGGFTKLLAETLPSGQVTALDESDEMLQATRELIEESGLVERVRYQRANLQQLNELRQDFDLVWASRTIHHLEDQLAGVQNLSRLIRPGGLLALREGSVHSRFLPDDIGIGEPGLQARLDVAYHQWFSQNVRGGGKRYPFGWTQLLRDAELMDIAAKTFVLEALPPFTDAQVRYMSRHLKRWLEDDDRRAAVAPEDLHTLELLTDPSSEHFLFSRPDLYLVETVTVFTGRRAT